MNTSKMPAPKTPVEEINDAIASLLTITDEDLMHDAIHIRNLSRAVDSLVTLRGNLG